METYQTQYIDVQTIYYHLNELRSLFEAFGNQTAIDTLNVIVGKIDDMTKVRGVRLKCRHATTNQELKMFAPNEEELEKYFDYMKESQAKELGLYALLNGMIQSKIEDTINPFPCKMITSEMEIIIPEETELKL